MSSRRDDAADFGPDALEKASHQRHVRFLPGTCGLAGSCSRAQHPDGQGWTPAGQGRSRPGGRGLVPNTCRSLAGRTVARRLLDRCHRTRALEAERPQELLGCSYRQPGGDPGAAAASPPMALGVYGPLPGSGDSRHGKNPAHLARGLPSGASNGRPGLC